MRPEVRALGRDCERAALVAVFFATAFFAGAAFLAAGFLVALTGFRCVVRAVLARTGARKRPV